MYHKGWFQNLRVECFSLGIYIFMFHFNCKIECSKSSDLNSQLHFCIMVGTLLRNLISKFNSFRNRSPPWNSDACDHSVHTVVVMNIKIWEPDKFRDKLILFWKHTALKGIVYLSIFLWGKPVSLLLFCFGLGGVGRNFEKRMY